MLELQGARISNAAQVGPTWDAALAADRPFVIDAVVDPTILAVPPHVTFEQTKNYLAAILKGDREAAYAMWRSFTDLVS
jgi:pyruvate dehydrogenase (quinone)